MDKIFIKDLEVYAYHGVNIEEKKMGQRFLISLELSISLRNAGISDDLKETVNYAELCHMVEEKFKEFSYDLIEKAGEELVKFILLKYEKIKTVKLLLKKPWAPIGKPINYAAIEIERSWHDAYISGGSNLGEKRENLEEAIRLLASREDIRLIKVSQFYQTKPVGYIDQDNFVNCAFYIKTLLEPKELMELLLNIEKELKRERIVKWGPRTVDLDIIFYDNLISSDDFIVIPHPRVHLRQFVLKPLCDIAPFYIHPLLNKRVISMSEELQMDF